MVDAQVALVTGATRGIGRVIALALARAGFSVVVTGRTMTEGEGQHESTGLPVPGSISATVAAIEETGGTAIGIRLDLLDRKSIDTAIAACLERFGRLDVLVANGIYQGPVVLQKMMEVDIAAAEQAAIGNFVNQFHLARAALAPMRAQGAGRMIFMTTLSSLIPTTGSSGLFYNGPKAAFNKIPDFINFEHGADGISAFLIEPRFTMTDTLRSVMGESAEDVGQGHAPYDPEDTAAATVWLAAHPDAPRYAGPDAINAPEFLREQGLSPNVSARKG